jgi:hypothetical protein
MPDQIIDMSDMAAVFSVTDQMGIHRESVRVELTKEDPGSIGRTGDNIIEITLPETELLEEFTARLQTELEAMGYEAQEVDEDEEDFL